MRGRSTYWHLEAQRRKPSDYEVVSSRLLYHGERGFEVQSPAAAWYDRFQRGSALKANDWEAFHDPRQTTYARYVELQRAQETFVDGLFRMVDGASPGRQDPDQALPPSWLDLLEQSLPVLRYPVHGLQMVAAYLGSLAPAGRIAIAYAFRSADELRRVQRIAYRMRQLARVRPGFGEQSRAKWERDAAWQPLRRVSEQLLATYDWGEAFVALDLVLKPLFDELFMVQFAALAAQNADHVWSSVCFSLAEDCRWQRQMSSALARLVLADVPENRALLADWIRAWAPRARQALDPLRELLAAGASRGVPALEPAWAELWKDCGLELEVVA